MGAPVSTRGRGERNLIGKTISHYRIIDKIGEGGMGVVYKAEDTSLHRTVALKFLPAHLARDGTEMARFVNEARAAAALNHPNICTIYEIDERAETPFISMEYIEGKDLKELAGGGPLPLEEAVRYASQIARALEEAHAKGVLHRDIKSANVVVSDKGHAIVMDFGLARMQGQTKLTQTGTTVGTVSYMSPEQAQGAEVDSRSDIWSLGVLLYRMVAGRYPFEGQHQSAVMYAVINEPHPPLTSLRTGVPMELERIVGKALAKNPAERYQSVSDLLVDLKAVRDQTAGSASRPAPAAGKTTGRSRVWMIAGAAVVAAAAALFAWQQLSRDGGGAPAPPTDDARVSIAVLPLDNMSADESQEYIADGMTEALIAELAQIHALRVTSRTSVMRFKKTTLPLSEVAATLGVSTIIEGSVMQAGGRMRVTAQLIDAETDEHLWAQSYERDVSDVLALQSDVARAIAREVSVELTPGENERLAVSKSIDPDAYDAYLRGRHHWYRRTGPDLRQARELFERVIEIEPEWAQGYLALAQTYVVMASWAVLPPGEAYPLGEENAAKALELDPGLGAAWACLAGVEAEWRWEWDMAEEYFRRAIEVEPSNASSHQWYGEFLCNQGRLDEAFEQINTAIELDPLALITRSVKAWAYFYQWNFDRAIAESEQILELDPDYLPGHNALAIASRYAEQHDRAAEHYVRYYNGFLPGAGDALRVAYQEGGMDALIRKIIAGSREARRTQYVSPANIAFEYASLGEVDSAMVWLERAYESRAFPLPSVAVTPWTESLHDDPRFMDLVQRMELREAWERGRRTLAVRP